jgi:uracil-DNA glycosylase
MTLKEQFGDGWYKLLEDLLNSVYFNKLGSYIKDQRKSNVIIPKDKSPLLFKAFRDVQPNKVKIVILGQDVYYNPEDAFDRYAFSNSTLLKPQPSLKNIIKEIEEEYPDSINLDRQDLSYLVKQGVLLVNTAMTVQKDKPNSHAKVWKNFTKYWISHLSNEYRDIIWLLWGNNAISYEPYIAEHMGHRVLCTSHPSPLAHTKMCGNNPPFSGSSIFMIANEELEARGKTKIDW